MKKHLFALILAAGVLLAASCGSGTQTDDTSSSDTPTADQDDEFVYETPLGEFLGWSNVDFNEEAQQAEWAEKERQVQEAIAACMQEQGFEYVPVDHAAQEAYFEEQFAEELEWGSDEWTAKYGFGISTQRFSQAQVGPDLVGHMWDQAMDDDGPPDPNQDYVESLTEAEREAYYEALFGGPDDWPIPVWEEEDREPTEEEMRAFDEEMENYQPTGCEPTAYEEMFNPEGDEETHHAFDAEFGQELEELDERVRSHPDAIAYRDRVQACVQERGLEYLPEDTAWEHFEDELSAAGLGWEDEPDPLEGIDTSEFTDEDFERAWREYQRQLLPPEKLEALAEIQATEIATAVALRECGGGWEAEERELAPIRIELEEEFLEANADRLAEFEGVFGN